MDSLSTSLLPPHPPLTLQYSSPEPKKKPLLGGSLHYGSFNDGYINIEYPTPSETYGFSKTSYRIFLVFFQTLNKSG